MKKYSSVFKEDSKWYDLTDNSIKKINSLNKPFSATIRRNNLLAKEVLRSIIICCNKHYGNKLTFTELFNLIKKVVKDTTIDDFNWTDDDLKKQIEQNFDGM